jgi:vacuolar protein sorting-associated protein 13A/C
MAKSFVLGKLESVLGEYVSGLSKENLKLGIFSGKVEFHNLEVKESALEKLQAHNDFVPLALLGASIEKVVLHIPWASLTKKPIQAYIRGVKVAVRPVINADFHDVESVKVSAFETIQRPSAYSLSSNPFVSTEVQV